MNQHPGTPSHLLFPDNFIFGTSVAAFQVEGNASGERKTDWDHFFKKNPDQIIRPGEAGPDWWKDTAIIDQDLKKIAELGVTMQRLSIEWARIEPERGQVSTKALARYRAIIDICKKHNLTPMITINHFTLPEWIARKGGWENPEIVSRIEHFTSILLDNFSDVQYWIIVNEPNILVYFGNLLGIVPPNKKNLISALKTRKNIIKAQQNIYTFIKKILPYSQVGNAFSFLWLRAYNQSSRLERYLAGKLNYLVNTNFVAATRDHMDFLGVNYYTGYYVDFKWNYLFPTMRNEAIYVPHHLPFAKTIRPKTYKSDMSWPIVPDFFLDMLTHIYKEYKKPILITENGIADRDDVYRPFYILTHLISVWKAIDEGVDIKGYIHWSTIDNLEWIEGFAKRFGLIAVDPFTGQRTLRSGSKVYAAIIKQKGISIEKMIEEFVPEKQKAYAHYVVKQLMSSTKNHCPRITKLL